MEPAAAVTILAVVLIILALVVYLVGVILELRKITAGLDVVSRAVGQIVDKSEPVNGIVEAVNKDLSAGTELLEGLLEKKAGPDDGPGLIESVFPGGGVAMLERQGRRGEVKNIDVVYTRGAVQLARLGRESPLGSGALSGKALRDATSSSSAARSLYSRPDAGTPSATTRSPTIGMDAPSAYPQRDEDGAPSEPARHNEQADGLRRPSGG